MTDKISNCEVCGQRVRVFSGSDGTNSYEGVDADELEVLKLSLKGYEKTVSDMVARFESTEAANETLAKENERLNGLMKFYGRSVVEIDMISELKNENAELKKNTNVQIVEVWKEKIDKLEKENAELRRKLLLCDKVCNAGEKIQMEIHFEGPNPRYHRDVVEKMKRGWPTLWTAIDEIETALNERRKA